MKLDIVRAWKDETYRQSLADEQLRALPANPAGELSDDELELVCGGGGGLGGGGGGGGGGVTPAAPVVTHFWHKHSSIVVGTTSSAAAATSESHIHSWSLLCDVSIFSINLIQVELVPIASPFNQCCTECH